MSYRISMMINEWSKICKYLQYSRRLINVSLPYLYSLKLTFYGSLQKVVAKLFISVCTPLYNMILLLLPSKDDFRQNFWLIVCGRNDVRSSLTSQPPTSLPLTTNAWVIPANTTWSWDEMSQLSPALITDL